MSLQQIQSAAKIERISAVSVHVDEIPAENMFIYDPVFLGTFSTFFAVTVSKFGANSTFETNTQITKSFRREYSFVSKYDALGK